MSSIKNTKCEICMKLFRGAVGLAEHQWRVHQIAKPAQQQIVLASPISEVLPKKLREFLRCPVCRGAVLEKNLKKHVRIKHPGSDQTAVYAEAFRAKSGTFDQDRPYRCQCGGLVRPSMSIAHQKAGHALRFTEGFRYPDSVNELPERDNESSVYAWSGGLPGLGKRH